MKFVVIRHGRLRELVQPPRETSFFIAGLVRPPVMDVCSEAQEVQGGIVTRSMDWGHPSGLCPAEYFGEPGSMTGCQR